MGDFKKMLKYDIFREVFNGQTQTTTPKTKRC